MSENSVKICLLGGSGVGKTCIINRFSNNVFDENTISTSGGSYSVKDVTVNNKTVHCNKINMNGRGQKANHCPQNTFFFKCHIFRKKCIQCKK